MRAGIAAKKATGLPLFVHIHATEFDRAGGHFGNPLVREIEYVGHTWRIIFCRFWSHQTDLD